MVSIDLALKEQWQVSRNSIHLKLNVVVRRNTALEISITDKSSTNAERPANSAVILLYIAQVHGCRHVWRHLLVGNRAIVCAGDVRIGCRARRRCTCCS